MDLLLDAMQMRKYKLLSYLYYNQGADLSVATLSNVFQVSKKTIVADLIEMEKKSTTIANKAVIRIKIDKGNIQFIISKKTSILEIRQYFLEESIAFKLLINLYQKQFIKLKNFSLTYYYSPSVVYKKVNELKVKLKGYGLTIKSEHGSIYLGGEEEKKRYFYSEIFYYVYGDRSSLLDTEKKVAENYLKKSKIRSNLIQESKQVRICIFIAVSLQRMKDFPLVKSRPPFFTDSIAMEKNFYLCLEDSYPQYSKIQLKIESQWMITFIYEEINPNVSEMDNPLFFEGLKRVSNLFNFSLTSQEGKEFKQLMTMYCRSKKNNLKNTVFSQLSFLNESVLDISPEIFLQVLIKENYKNEFETLLYPLNLEECSYILKISGVGIKKLKLTFVSEYPKVWEKFLYRKILTLEIEQFYKWSDDFTNADIVITDNVYSFIDDKQLLLISPFPSDREIKKVQNQLISYINSSSINLNPPLKREKV